MKTAETCVQINASIVTPESLVGGDGDSDGDDCCVVCHRCQRRLCTQLRKSIIYKTRIFSISAEYILVHFCALNSGCFCVGFKSPNMPTDDDCCKTLSSLVFSGRIKTFQPPDGSQKYNICTSTSRIIYTANTKKHTFYDVMPISDGSYRRKFICTSTHKTHACDTLSSLSHQRKRGR